MVRIQNIVIPAQKFKQTIAFYRDSLGFPAFFENSNYCFLQAGDVNIAIHPVDPTSDVIPTGRGLYLEISINNREQTKEQLLATHVTILKEWDEPIGKSLLIADPEGTLLKLTEITS